LIIDLLKDAAYSLRVLLHLPRADLIVVNCFWLPAILSLFQRVPVISLGKTVMNLQRMPKGQLQLYRFTSRIAATSTAVAAEAHRQTPAVSRLVKVLPNPIDTAAFARSSASAPAQGPPVVLYTGRIHPEKGLVLLVRACGRLVREGAALKLRLIGPSATNQGGGGQQFIDELNSAAKASGVDLELRPPVVSRADLAREIWDCTVYCYPSLADQGESFGVAPLEAMAAGVAPIVSDLACFRDFVDPEQNAVVFDHRGEAAEANLAEAIRRLLSSADLRNRLGRSAVATAQRFSIAAVADQYLTDFATITGLPAIAKDAAKP
jgi:glycosyltransferase involved in cell wall biosynthesis